MPAHRNASGYPIPLGHGYGIIAITAAEEPRESVAGIGRSTAGAGDHEYRNSYAWMIEIKEGKIFKVREHMDSHYVTTLV
jgi:ketosteroid isomerase-like protein